MSSNEARKPFKTIGEVASELGLAQHVLRFWEGKFPHVSPQKRRGGHRYYSHEDVVALHEIKSLLYEQGYTIKGAQQYVKQKQSAGQGRVQGTVSKPSAVNVNDSEDDHVSPNNAPSWSIHDAEALHGIYDKLKTIQKRVNGLSQA